METPQVELDASVRAEIKAALARCKLYPYREYGRDLIVVPDEGSPPPDDSLTAALTVGWQIGTNPIDGLPEFTRAASGTSFAYSHDEGAPRYRELRPPAEWVPIMREIIAERRAAA